MDDVITDGGQYSVVIEGGQLPQKANLLGND